MVTPEHPAMQVSSQKSQVRRHILIPFRQKQHCYHTDSTYLMIVVGFSSLSLSHAAGYSSNYSSLTDLTHRRSESGSSASTGIGSILEPGDQQVERGERESRTTPPTSTTCHHATEHPSTPAKGPR